VAVFRAAASDVKSQGPVRARNTYAYWLILRPLGYSACAGIPGGTYWYVETQAQQVFDAVVTTSDHAHTVQRNAADFISLRNKPQGGLVPVARHLVTAKPRQRLLRGPVAPGTAFSIGISTSS
jgi:hypothetical protein